jgi:uncharacterized protein
MPGDVIGQWEKTRAEIEIRRWLYKIGQWAPGAEQFGSQSQEETEPLGALSEDEIDQVLRSEMVGRIGCHADGKTYVVPIIYVYYNGCIYGHSAEGMKLRMMRANPAVCFEVDHVESVTSWQSVIAWGRFEDLRGNNADRVTRLLVDRFKPLTAATEDQPHHGHAPDGSDHVAVEAQRAVVYRITLTERSGRYEKC